MTPHDLEMLVALRENPDIKRICDYTRDKWDFTLMFVRFFSKDNKELAYYSPLLQPEGDLVIFEPPREWSVNELARIGLQ